MLSLQQYLPIFEKEKAAIADLFIIFIFFFDNYAMGFLWFVGHKRGKFTCDIRPNKLNFH